MESFIAHCTREKEKFKTLAKTEVKTKNDINKCCHYAVDFANVLDYFASMAKKRMPERWEEINDIYKYYIRRYVEFLNSIKV